MSIAIFDPDTLRQQALQLLRTEGRAITTGELAVRLQTQPHRIAIVLDQPMFDGRAYHVPGAGWRADPEFADFQQENA